MFNKRSALLIIALLVPLMLAACGGGGPDADDVESALRKAFEEGDTSDLNELVCEEDRAEEDDGFAAPGEVEVSNVECDVDDDSFSCDIELSAEGQSLQMTISGDVVDDELCNIGEPEVQLPDAE